jgi:hypothetical protein
MSKYRYDAKLGRMVDADGNFCNEDTSSWVPEAPSFMPDIAEFVSPIDNTIISSRAALKAHERKHNVVQVGDSFGNTLELEKKRVSDLWKGADLRRLRWEDHHD